VTGFGDPNSAWWFFGRLRPEHATGFNVQEVVVEDLARLEVYHDRIAVWTKPGAKFVPEPATARDLFALVVGAYSVVSGIPLDWSLEGWVEATDADLAGSVVGTVPDTRARPSPMRAQDAIECRRMRAAAELAVLIRSKPGYRLALRDIHQALLLEKTTRSDDALFFGYRSLVDVARAVSGRCSGDTSSGDWDRLATRLGVDSTELANRKAGLEKARHALAHGDETHPDLVSARAQRGPLIEDARLLIAEALGADPNLGFDLSLVVTSGA
jgi:hypothetical protein